MLGDCGFDQIGEVFLCASCAAGSCWGCRGRTDSRRKPSRRSIAPTLRSAKITLNRVLITRAKSTRRQRTTPMFGKVWSFANQLCYCRLLLWREPWFRSSCYAVAEPGDSFGVVAENPVAQGLTVHAAELAGFAPLISFKHQGQRQHPPRCIGIIAASRHLAQLRCRVIGARDCQSFRHQNLPEIIANPKRITPARICKDPLSQRSMPLVLEDQAALKVPGGIHRVYRRERLWNRYPGRV